MFFDATLLDSIAKGSLLSLLGLIWIILLVRIVGLRSFSKMTNFDFVITVAMGSLLAGASQVGAWADLVQVIIAMAALFTAQFTVAYMRQQAPKFDSLVQNAPVLLMRDGEILHAALRKTRVTQDDLLAKLREANALDLKSVRAVILETTGDVSVLHGKHVDQILLDGIKAPAP